MNQPISAPWATRDAATKTSAAAPAPQASENEPEAGGSTNTPSEGANGPDSAAQAPGSGIVASANSPAVEVADEITVTVTVPKAFNLRTGHGDAGLFTYQPGVQEMPLSHADHWYSKANGVKIYEK